jgi:hypothetical protein
LPRVITHESVAQIRGRNGRTLNRHRDGTFHMSPEAAKRAVKAGEASIVPDMGPAAKGVGYVCASCGFGSYFIRCGQCGGDCRKAT